MNDIQVEEFVQMVINNISDGKNVIEKDSIQIRFPSGEPKEALISFDCGKTFVSLMIAKKAIDAFADRYADVMVE